MIKLFETLIMLRKVSITSYKIFMSQLRERQILTNIARAFSLLKENKSICAETPVHEPHLPKRHVFVNTRF